MYTVLIISKLMPSECYGLYTNSSVRCPEAIRTNFALEKLSNYCLA